MVGEHGHEERLAREQALARAHERAHHAAALALLRAVAEDRLHLDAVFAVHHATRFRDDGLSWVELDLHELQVVTDDLVIDLVHRRHGVSPRGKGSGQRGEVYQTPLPARRASLRFPRPAGFRWQLAQ